MSTFIWNGCSLFDEEEPIPSYIYIDEILLDTDEITEGSNKHDIKDVWISVNGEFLGVYPLPALVPVLETGVQEVRLFPGISVSGLSDFRITNPFYTFYENDIDLEAGAIDTIQPVVSYDDNTVFLLVEDFETSNLMTHDVDENLETKVVARATDVFEGAKSGEIELTSENGFIEVGSNLTYQIPDPEYVYLEIHYKNEIDLEFGLLSYENNTPFEKQYVSGVFPSDEWKKIYIDITNDVKLMQTSGGEEFRVIVRGIYTGDDKAYAYLDNIKLIYQ